MAAALVVAACGADDVADPDDPSPADQASSETTAAASDDADDEDPDADEDNADDDEAGGDEAGGDEDGGDDEAADAAPAEPGSFVALPAQPADVPFPTDKWPEAELTDHLSAENAAAVEAVVADAFDEAAPYGSIEAIVVIAGGELVEEAYGRGFSADQVHVSWSVGKSVTHAMLGIATRDSLLDVFEPAAVAEWQDAGDPRAEITPDMLARMSSGLGWNEGFDAFALVQTAAEVEAAASQIDRELEAEPDSEFNYSTGSTAINGRLLGDLIGTGETFQTWADDELFDPLGIRSVELEYDGSGYFIAGYGANMTARDFARFGLLYQRDGVWDGERILPEGWVDYARTPSPTFDDYGSGFWLVGDIFSAAGFRGQRVVMVPEVDVILVILADEGNDQNITDLTVDLLAPFSS